MQWVMHRVLLPRFDFEPALLFIVSVSGEVLLCVGGSAISVP
jgi:hypothetical protein